jgi:hypothetical protein
MQLAEGRLKVQVDSKFKIQDSRFKIGDWRIDVQSSKFKVQGSRIFKVGGSC